MVATGLRVIMVLVGLAGQARAQEPGAEPPLYPEHVLPTDDSFSGDAALTAFRRAAAEAGEARTIDADGNEVYDPAAMLPFLADEVELLVARQDGVLDDEFRSLGRHDPRVALEIAGRLHQRDVGPVAIVGQRYGMQAVGSLVAEETVGHSPWLGGRICTASYGRIGWPAWLALTARLPSTIDDWVVAVAVQRNGIEAEGPVAAGWPKRYQLVPLSPEQKASAGSTGILTPDGVRVFFATSFGDSTAHFARYRNDHVCFERREAGWTITAIAMRLE